MRATSLILLAVLVVAAGCAGTTSKPTSTPPTSGGNSVTTSSLGDQGVTISFTIPRAGTTSKTRRPAYISPSTESATVSVSPQPSTHPASVSLTCTPAGQPTQCSGQIFAPPGNDSFLVDLYDAQGRLLAQGETTTEVTTTTQVTVTTTPVLGSVGLAVSPPFVLGAAGSSSLNVVAYDVDGNPLPSSSVPFIDGANTQPVTLRLVLTQSPSSPATVSLGGGTEVDLTSPPGTPIPLAYTGGTFTSFTISATATTPINGNPLAPSTTFTPSALTVTPAPATPVPTTAPTTAPTTTPTTAPQATLNDTNLTTGLIYPAIANVITSGPDLSIFFANPPAFTAAVADSTQNFSPATLSVPNGQTALLFLTWTFSGSGTDAGMGGSGASADFCFVSSLLPNGATYTATYTQNGVVLGSSGTIYNTPSTTDGNCSNGYTHLSFNTVSLTVVNGDQLGLVISHN
jgi:hypothetical protein